ncbi:histone-lysine N-methyltransferase SETMAR-like [Ooceraea biroi]|uniref:histone-lysine N-methyltransferase SETMAR-like n=1 Tax=Ooceraea biroi TaxID=2015173 RepID=UPI000F084175|nr:histone-lysine N-methyltransferase SETMAR-like [Ooceraea biroi]
MEQNKQYFRYLMLFYFHKGKNATQTKEKICAVYGEDAVSERVCQNRFAEFRASGTTCEDGKRSGRPLVADDDQIKTVIENNPHYTTRDIAQIVSVSQKTVVNRSDTLGYVSRFDVWVPHNLTENNLMDRISICDSLLKRNENNPFLKRIVTGDEKWIVYKNVERKRSWGERDERGKPHQSKTYTQKESYCVFGGIGKESYWVIKYETLQM